MRRVLLVLLMVGVVLVLSAGPTSAIEWVQNPANGHFYTVVRSQTPMDWPQAESLAVGLGGHLATINDAQENAWVLGVLDQTMEPNGWIGLYQDRTAPDYWEPGGGWRWASGEPVTYTNWTSQAPNNLYGREDWAYMYSSHFGEAGRWEDRAEHVFYPPESDPRYSTYVGIVEVVPEPSSLLALLGGLVGIGGTVWRRRR